MSQFQPKRLFIYSDSGVFTLIHSVKSRTICGYLHIILYTSLRFLYVNHFWLFKIVFKFSGDVEENPVPTPSSSQSFSICHWSLNSISADNYIKLLHLLINLM